MIHAARRLHRILLGLVALPLLCAGCGGDDPIQLAFVGPLSGTSAVEGQSAVRGIELVLAEINANGGVGGRRVELAVHDDANDPERARELARTLVADGETLAVIGHNTSSCSVAAGAIYGEGGLPAVAAAATSVGVTADNPYYFRVIYNDRDQGRTVVAYANAILGAERLAIVYEADDYGSYLAFVMQEAASQIGSPIEAVFAIDGRAPDLEAQLDSIAASIAAETRPPVLVIATQPEAGVGLVQRLRDAGYPGRMIVTDALASNAFADGFMHLAKERAQPGYYSQGIFASTPFLFDTGGREAGDFVRRFLQAYSAAPDWYAAFAADAAETIVAALRRSGLAASGRTLPEDRAALRDALAAIGPWAPVSGVTGETWFDEVGDAEKPVLMGRFLNGELDSALAQLEPLPAELGPADAARFDPARVYTMGDERRYRSEVARVGIRARRFLELALDEGVFELEFDIWFRHAGDPGVEDIIFTNAIEPVVLGAPVEEWLEDGLHYRRYRTRGRFRADILPPLYGEHVLGLVMEHRTRPRSELILAMDRLGMNLGRASTRADRGAPARRLLDATSPWTVRDLIFFEDERQVPGFGHPAFLTHARATRPVSELTVAIFVERSGFSLRRLLVLGSPGTVLGVSLAASLLLLGVGRRSDSRVRFILQVLFALAILASLEPLVAGAALQSGSAVKGSSIRHVFDVLWWIVPALLVNAAITRFVWRPAEERSGNPIPTLLRWSVASLVVVIAFFGVIAFVYDYRLTGLLATSGVVAMIIGLAVQLNITNIFAGVALNLERPFRVGDWIMIHGRTPDPDSSVIGQVVDINWRTTRLRTADDTEIVIPNGIISEKTITNFMHPGELSRFELDFTVDQSHAPEEVIGLMREALQGVLGTENQGPVADPPPSVRIKETTERGIVYQVRYRLIPREVSPAKARHTINDAVLRALRRAGIELAYPRRDVYEHRVVE